MQNPKLPFVRDGNGLFVPVLPNLGLSLPFAPGNIYHVRPRYGSNITNNGLRPESAFKTLRQALSKAKADQNDVVLFYSEGNSGSVTTDYQSAQLDWNKDLVHLIGVNAGGNISPRSRIAPVLATYVSADPLFKLSASGCLIRGVQTIMEATSVNPLGAMTVTGQRNQIENSHIYGFANAAQDILGAYSLLLDGAEENEFRNCTIGSDRLPQGAYANSQLKLANVAKNNTFVDCVIKLCSTSATNHVFVRAPTGSLDGALTFIRTIGVNSKHRNVGAAELTYAMVVASDAGGDVILDPGSAFQAADVNNDSGNVYGAGATAGILVPVVK